MSEVPLRAVFAARLIQARELRGISQRALGDKMGLGKEKGSSRINRYERQVTAIGFDSLQQLADALGVPPAYLIADSPVMADTILALSGLAERDHQPLASLLTLLASDAELTEALTGILSAQNQVDVHKREQLMQSLRTILAPKD